MRNAIRGLCGKGETNITGKTAYAICLLSVILFCAPFFQFEYATDTYTVITVGLSSFGDSMVANGRLITASFFYTFDALSLGIVSFYYTSFLLSLFFASLAVYQLYTVLNSRLKTLPAFLFSFLTLLNPLSIEYFLFIEKGFFWFAICMSVSAFKHFVRFLEGERKHILLSYLYITLAAFVYQTIPGAFAALAVLFVALYAKNIGEIAKNTFFAVSVYGFGSILDFLFIKFWGGTQRVSSEIRFSNLGKLLFSAGYWQTLLMFAAVSALLFGICCLYTRIRTQKYLCKETVVQFFKCIYIITGTLTVTLFPLLLVQPNEVWLPCRIAYPLGLLIGTLPLAFCFRLKENENDAIAQIQTPRQTSRVLSIVLCVFFAADLIFFQAVMIGRLVNNATDEALCAKIEAYIETYERESGIEVLSVSIYHDASVTAHNPGVLFLGDSNVRAFSKDWSDVTHMNVLLDRNFAKLEGDAEIYQTHFAEKNWDSFHPDQLVFAGNTLHLCVY